MQPSPCPTLRSSYHSLLTLREEFRTELKKAAQPGDYAKLESLKKQMEHHRDETCRDEIGSFLDRELRLALHPGKVSIWRWSQGVDFLGYMHFPFHCAIRAKTRRRMFARVSADNLASYLGVTRHARARLAERKMGGILGA